MNLVFMSGNLAKDPSIHQQKGKSILAVIDLVGESHRKTKEFHKVVCFGSLAEMARDKLKKGMYVTVMGILERKSYMKAGSWSARTQIVAKQFMVPVHPKFSKWFHLALMMAEGGEFEGPSDGAASGSWEEEVGTDGSSSEGD